MKINLGKNIKYLREKNNLDQQKFADVLGVPRSTLACWENGLRTPKLEQIVKIAEYFGTNLDIIYKDLENVAFNLSDDIHSRYCCSADFCSRFKFLVGS